jgi:Spy/CpxP family protein refolding chaperone
MADNQIVDIGKYAKHPRRTAVGAMLIGTALGAGMMAAKNHRSKSPMQKFIDKMGNHYM